MMSEKMLDFLDSVKWIFCALGCLLAMAIA